MLFDNWIDLILTLGGGMADTTDLDRLAKIIGLDEERQMSPKVGNSLVKRNQIRWSPTIQVIPSQALIYKRRCRDLTVPICKMMKVKSRLQTEMVVKTIVVRKSVAKYLAWGFESLPRDHLM
jgi:hypothetical protein